MDRNLRHHAKKYKLEIREFVNYIDVIHAVRNVEFIASDSNGLQMESYYLNRPYLLLAKSSQGSIGIGQTAYLSYLDKKRFNFFLKKNKKFKRKTKIQKSPSKIILNFF